jgi:hypothetical protein
MNLCGLTLSSRNDMENKTIRIHLHFKFAPFLLQLFECGIFFGFSPK